MINSDIIINRLKEELEPIEYIYAMWLEGADAIGEEDEYSDLDVYIDIEDKIDMLRLIYTPAFAHYYLIHISKHIPKDEAQRLEYFAKISSLKDIEEKVSEAEKWFKELLCRLEEKNK